MTRIVGSFGALYRISEREYRRQLRLIASGAGYCLPEDKCIGELAVNLSSVDADEAGYLLAELGGK